MLSFASAEFVACIRWPLEHFVDNEQQEEFSAIRQYATDALRTGLLIEGRTLPVCQLLILPSFDNPVSWDVVSYFSREDGKQTRLVRSTWRMDVDHEALRSPVERQKHPRPYQPTLESGWVLLDAEKLEALLAQVRSIRIPLLVAEAPMGLDGITYELAFGEFFCNSRIVWWCNMPQEWRELEPSVAELERLFESTWESRPGGG
ncbi:hypothetical protein [Anatilimnocola floriformis]|uniref:hypothetical protein n=1 Tax=Anatilimnocola floriformis TaxID=2948575 RepID=UPI0020C3F026|nr:hypothetical protein [Anatilimnocola floriformis]